MLRRVLMLRKPWSETHEACLGASLYRFVLGLVLLHTLLHQPKRSESTTGPIVGAIELQRWPRENPSPSAIQFPLFRPPVGSLRIARNSELFARCGSSGDVFHLAVDEVFVRLSPFARLLVRFRLTAPRTVHCGATHGRYGWGVCPPWQV